MPRNRPQSHAFLASTCLLLAAVANRSLTGAAFLVAFGIWGAVVVATSGGGGSSSSAREDLGLRGRWDSRRLGHGLWAAVAALAAVVTAAQACHAPCASAAGTATLDEQQPPVLRCSGLHGSQRRAAYH